MVPNIQPPWCWLYMPNSFDLPKTNSAKCSATSIFADLSFRWSPQQEKDEELYCASLLALFKPWRVLGDLHVPGISFSASLVSFLNLASADNKVGDLVGNIKYSHHMGC
jgi:hypothetical protein